MVNRIYKISLIIIFFLFLMLFNSCTESRQNNLPEEQSQKADQAKKEQIPFRITWTDYSGRGVTIGKIVEAYNKKPGNKYEIILQSGNEDIKAVEEVLSKEGAEPVFVLPYRYVQYLGDKGLLENLTISFLEQKDLFYSELWKLGTVNGEVYGIPWLGHSICLIYNKSLLKEAGVSPDSINSLDTLLIAINAVEAKTKAKGIGLVGANHNDVSWMVNQFVYGFGSKLVDESGKKVVINNEKAKSAISYYKNTLGPHAQPTWLTDTGVEVMNYFRKQEIAFEFQGVWGVTDIEKNGNPFEVGIINLEDIGLFAEVGPLMLSVPKSMADYKKQEAVRFINYMISQEAQEQIMFGEYSPEHDAYYPFRVPVRLDFADSLVSKKYPQYQPFIKGFKRPSIDVPVPKWQVIKDTYYQPGLNQVMKSEILIDDFLKTIESKGNEILNR